jgi:hypothetical protein
MLDSGTPLTFRAPLRSARQAGLLEGVFVPFAEAGRDGGHYRVWMRGPGVEFPRGLSLLADGVETRSREGNVSGAINDGDSGTFVVTFDGKAEKEDWFAVALDNPVSFKRIVFAHGQNFHDGGWFDTRDGKPRVEVQRAKGEAWKPLGGLSSYPATTDTHPAGLEPGQSFELRLPASETAVAVRVVGKPASGDNPAQAFSSCAELQVLDE